MRRTIQHDFDLNFLFASLSGESRVVVGVSGGSDSLALLHLLHEWMLPRSQSDLVVVTVDHGLRVEAASEAESVADTCKRLDLPHVIKRWQGKKPASALSRRAREARYRLLSEAAKEAGATAIALGHTLNDQLETVSMRAKRIEFTEFDSDVNENTARGLAGIRPLGSYCGPPDFQPVRLLRPLLTTGREELRTILRDSDIIWSDDPGNEDHKYERARVRQDLEPVFEARERVDKIAQFADCVALEREKLATKCGEFILSHVKIDKTGVVYFEQKNLKNCSDLVGELVMRVLVAVAGGRNYFVSRTSAQSVLRQIQRDGDAVVTGKYTLGSAIIERGNTFVKLWREYRNLPEVTVIQQNGRSHAYDGRVVVTFDNEHLNQGLELRALGVDGLAYMEKISGERVPCVPRAALWAQPALYKHGVPVFVPMLPWSVAGFNRPAWKFWTPALEHFQLDCDRNVLAAVRKIRPSGH